LAFYAALRPEDDLSAMYLGLSDRGEMTEVEQSEIGMLRDLLLQGVLDDLGRMREGEPLVALGQGQSCQYCQARGLCRRDFVWAQSEPS
jgi:ATP-dependent helicase/nuclease subunit B